MQEYYGKSHNPVEGMLLSQQAYEYFIARLEDGILDL
jgi:hypothetical protein